MTSGVNTFFIVIREPEKSDGHAKSDRDGITMAETNGSGRLDRIEAILERLAEVQERDHEEFTRDHKQLMTWQVLMQDKMDKAEAARQKDREDAARESARLDARVDKLVSSIGELIARIPPASLR